MTQSIFDWFFANLGTIGSVAGFIASFIGGAYSLWLWADSDRKLRIAEVELLEGKLSRARTQASEYQAAAEAAHRDIKESKLAAVLEQHDQLFKQGEYERAAAILKEFFARERHNLGRVASELGDWYGQFIGDEGAGSALPQAQRFYGIATRAAPENQRWRSTAEELKLVAELDTLNQGQLSADADEFDDHFAFAAGSRREDAEALVEALTRRSKALGEEGNYQAAYLLARRAYHLAERSLGDQHRATLMAQNWFALSLRLLGFYDEALPHFQQVLAIREKAQGAEHPDTAESLNNLALLYYDLGRYDAAEPLYIRALAICEKALGAEHPDTAQSLNNLAALYYAQGRYDAAEPLNIRAQAIREKALGSEHPDTARSLNNLAMLYDAQGRYDAAEPLYIRALAIREKTLGAEHPDTATILNNLAAFYSSQGRYDAAEPLIIRALAIREKALGAEHPMTVIARNNLAALREERAEAAGQIPQAAGSGRNVQVNFGTPDPKPEAHPD